MRILLVLIFAVVALAATSSFLLSRPVVEGRLDQAAFESMSLAPVDRALTLARNRAGRTLLVTAVGLHGIEALDVQAASGSSITDALDAYRQLGTQGLRALYGTSPALSYKWEELAMPVAAGYPHVAAGTNYREHADEVGHEGDPFLFPKLSHATAWDSPVQAGTRLDYEVELCAVLLTDHQPAAAAELGYVLCGDYTDRWLLVRDIDLDGDMGYTGFPLGKGGDSRLPIGPLLLLPLEQDFYRELEISLYANDVLRQKTLAGEMIWPPLKLLDETLAQCRSAYHLEQEIINIAPCDHVPAGSLLMTGTPGGVLFNPATLWNPWLYLRKGDVVTSFGAYLGWMRNEIIAPQVALSAGESPVPE